MSLEIQPMNVIPLKIRRIDSRQEDIRAAMAQLRARLSPQGNVVSEAGRQRTIEVFGQPLSPQQVVERICRDVQEKGLAAVLDYSARIDKAPLTADTVRVPAAELSKAHSEADPQFLEAVRRVWRATRSLLMLIKSKLNLACTFGVRQIPGDQIVGTACPDLQRCNATGAWVDIVVGIFMRMH